MSRNPFDVLGATPRDNRRRLASLTEDMALLGSSQEAQEAHSALLQPESRLRAEIRWTPEKKNEELQEVSLAKLNSLYAGLMSEIVLNRINSRVLDLCEAYGEVKEERIARWISDAREAAGFQAIELSEAAAALADYAREIAQAVCQKLDRDEIKSRIRDAAARLADCCAQKPAFAGNQLVREMFAAYELRIASKAETYAKEVRRISDQIQDEKYKRLNNKDVSDLIHNLRGWCSLVSPLRTMTKAAGRNPARYHSCYYQAHNALVDVLNKFHNVNCGYELIGAIRECFGAEPEFAGIINQMYQNVETRWRAREEANAKTRDGALRSLLSLVAIVLVVLLMNGCEVKEKKVNVVDIDPAFKYIMESREKTEKELKEQRELLYSLQIQSLRREVEELEAQMKEALEAYQKEPSGVKLALYRKLESTCNEKRERLGEVRKKLKDLNQGDSVYDYIFGTP